METLSPISKRISLLLRKSHKRPHLSVGYFTKKMGICQGLFLAGHSPPPGHFRFIFSPYSLQVVPITRCAGKAIRTLFRKGFRATPHNSARAGGEGFFLSRKFGKQRNTWCISCFPNCADGGKDPPSGRRRICAVLP